MAQDMKTETENNQITDEFFSFGERAKRFSKGLIPGGSKLKTAGGVAAAITAAVPGIVRAQEDVGLNQNADQAWTIPDQTDQPDDATTPTDTADVIATSEVAPYPDRFGDIEKDGVEFVNRGIVRGVVQGDPDLYQNMLWRRDNFGQFPDIRRRVYFYDDQDQMNKLSGVPYDYPNNTNIIVSTSEIVEYAEDRWKILDDGTIEFHIPLPKPIVELTPTNLIAQQKKLSDLIVSVLWSKQDGKSGGVNVQDVLNRRDDINNHPIYVDNDASNFNAALYVAGEPYS